MKYFLIVILSLNLSVSSAQSPPVFFGTEVATNYWQQNISMASIFGEVVFLDSSIMLRASFGGFFPKSSSDLDEWDGKMFKLGLTAGYYLRSGKKYQPGITFELNTMIPPSSAEPVYSNVFSNSIYILGSKFKSIPLSFSPKITHLFWSDRLGIELGVGYRYYLRHLQSGILANFYRPMHLIEWSFGLRFRVN